MAGSQLLQLTQEEIAIFLQDFLLRKTKNAQAIDPSYERLWETINDTVLAGGKRLRPYLTLLAYSHDKPNSIADALSVAAAQELLHAALLIHDDVIDRDTIRHGTKNITGRYIDTYEPYAPRDSATHYAYGASILAGDLLIAAAHELIFTSSWSQEKKQSLLQLLEQSIFEVAGGELMDVEAAFMQDQSYDPFSIYRYKTAGYSFITPLLSGATLADSSEETKTALKEFGKQLGTAYQLQDDILGIFGDEVLTGKSTSCDLREAKQTLLVTTFLGRASDEERAMFTAIFGKEDAKETLLQQVRDLIESTGAKNEVIKSIEKYSAAAREALSPLNDTKEKAELLSLVDKLVSRKY